MSREQLVAMAKSNLAHARNGTIAPVDDVLRVPASHYVDPARWEREMDAIFRRVPLVLGFSAEIPNPGDYKALNYLDVPALITRGADGVVRSFVNMCSHRGAVIMEEGTGSARRFTCPYHAWSYDQQGALVGILDREMFGEVDASCHGLTALPIAERAGILFGSITPDEHIDIDTWLCGYDSLLTELQLDKCRVVGEQRIPGPNWKVAYDGYLDLYHLPILHRNTFGTEISNRAVYYAWGPHQRVSSPTRNTVEALDPTAAGNWPTERLTLGVWTIFPHVSIASFDAGGRIFMVSQLVPGPDHLSSTTVQTFLHTQPDAPGQAEEVAGRMKFLDHVVRDEDYYTGLRIQRALATGTRSHVLFGRNEGGGQRFHAWVDALCNADDASLPTAVKTGIGMDTEPLI